MKKRTLSLNFTAYDKLEELPPADVQLLAEAKVALTKAYAPYSNFQVGAAARLANGAIVNGANCENASYPLCICAEPATLAAAASQYPGVAVVELAITVASANQTVDQPATPCGACRQMLVEHEQR
ncbi:MAG: cytidine deaminase, partial [Bacteroidota bacterium]